MGYAKLFSSITESSLWSEPKEVRLLFVTMLAKARADGFVEASLPGLARVSNLSLSETQQAIEILEAPDPHSKIPDNEGRRILKVEGGWMVLNYQAYRHRQSEEERREYMREYMQNYRSGKQPVNNVKKCKDFPSASASALQKGECEGIPESLQTDAFQTEWEAFKAHRKKLRCALTPHAAHLILRRLSQRPQEAVAALEMAQEAGWKGFEWQWFDDRRKNKSAPQKKKGGASLTQEQLDRIPVETP